MSKAPKKKSPEIKRKGPPQTSPPALYTVRTKKAGEPSLEYLSQLQNLSVEEWNLIREDQITMPFLDSTKLRQVAARPFLKWVGGKTALLPNLEPFIPSQVDRYIEPFLGGGAMFFFLKRKFPKMRAFLRDSNKELINCYHS